MYSDKSLPELAGKFLRLVTRRSAFPPQDIAIELSTACDAACGMCFRGPLGIRPALMSALTFEKIKGRLLEAYGAAGPAYVNFVGLGEILLNPDLERILSSFKTSFPGARANISTNLLRWDPALFRRLLSGRLADRVSVSIDDTGDAGPWYHPCCAAAAENIRALGALNRELGSPSELRLQAVMISEAQALRVLGLAAEAGASILSLNRMTPHLSPAGARPPRPAPPQERAILAAARAAAAGRGLRVWNNNAFDLPMRLASAGGRFCLTSDDHLFIDVGGRVSPCFCLRGQAWGSALEEPLSELYGKKPDFYALQPEVCGGCDVYREEQTGR